VSKFLYDTKLKPAQRWDVVVFKWPKTPITNGVPKNYIKRLLGLPGELLAILFGRIYVADNPPGHTDGEQANPNDLWKEQFMHSKTLSLQQPEGQAFWKEHGFTIQRKPVGTMMAMRRIVFDNDFPPRDARYTLPPRWQGEGNWLDLPKTEHGFRHNGEPAEQVDWLRYRHYVRSSKDSKPQLITDFMGYNSQQTSGAQGSDYDPHKHNWVGDLMLECTLKVQKAQGEFVMELSKGIDRFQAHWDLSNGTCTLYRLTGEKNEKKKRVELGKKETRLKAPGEYELRFANIDERLTVWVGGELPFDEGVPYSEPEQRGPRDNDLEPASVGSKGAAAQVRHLRLWRDTYYTLDHKSPSDALHTADVNYADSDTWRPLRELPYRAMYVQPGHYLCLGDTSPYSSDSRDWGTVPERLMLGRALMVYYPFSRAGRIK
jgi:signal peptidase I